MELHLDPLSFAPELASKSYPRDPGRVVWFSKSAAPYGLLQNMTGGMPVIVAGRTYLGTEPLYQVVRYSGRPDVQRLVAGASSCFESKLVTRGMDPQNQGLRYRESATHQDWNRIRFAVLIWVLEVKTLQHWNLVVPALRETDGRELVELSERDPLFGAVPRDGELVGANVLGQAWIWIRERIPALAARRGWGLAAPTFPGMTVLNRDDEPVPVPVVRDERAPCTRPHVPNLAWPPRASSRLGAEDASDHGDTIVR